MTEQATLKDGPLNGVRVTIAPGQTRLQVAERMGPPRVNSRSMPPEIVVAAKVGEYVQGTTPGDFIWAGWGR